MGAQRASARLGGGSAPPAARAAAADDHPVLRPVARLAVLVLVLVLLVLPELATTANAQEPQAPAGAGPADAGPAYARYPRWTGPELLAAFDDLELAGTARPDAPPAITGHPEADARIRRLAEDRGYRLRPAANVPLVPVDGQLLHPVAAEALRSLQLAAAADGAPFVLASGHRSPDLQRSTFLGRLAATPEQVAAGTADDAVDEVLAWIAPPGYSKHQTGYAADLAEPGRTIEAFGGSAAHRWLSADHHRNARRFGFLPSYPPDGGTQGPEPEPWEYVYVGTAASGVDLAFGALDGVRREGDDLRVSGWAVDPSDPGAAVVVHVYVGGPAGAPGAVGTDLGPAADGRADVGAAHLDTGPDHGFDATVELGDHEGRVPVCAYALDRPDTPGGAALLGCREVTVGTAAGADRLRQLLGGLERLASLGADRD